MNNIFKYATKELSQDAFLCWSINWLTEGSENPLYPYGKAMLDLFLGDKKQDQYFEVKIRNQYEKIDVLVLFKDGEGNSHALIIEDKTNTSEHGDQMRRYQNKILEKTSTDTSLKVYENPEVHLAYVKTGIMYDEDVRMVGKGANVVDLDALLNVVSRFAQLGVSEILSNFNDHIQGIKNHRVAIETQIENGHYEIALQDPYGQFYFLDKIFSARSKGTKMGSGYTDEKNDPIYVDYIYSGTSNNGTPWIQYRFWGDKYPENFLNKDENEYHYMFWRIDGDPRKDKADEDYSPNVYIALRHYDEHARSGDPYLDGRKKFVYHKLRACADKACEKHPQIFAKIRGGTEKNKESDLISISFEEIKHMKLDEIRVVLTEITDLLDRQYEDLYCGMAEALKDD